MKFLVFGGGGKVSRHFARLATAEGDEVVSVVRNEDHFPDLKSLGARPVVLSLETASVPSLTSLLTSERPDAVVWSAGAGGKGDKSRTRTVDYEGAVKVFDALEAANVRRLLYVGAIDVRDKTQPPPQHYTPESDMQAKYDAEVELHTRKTLQFTVLRPGGLTLEPARGVELGITQVGKTSRELVAQVLLAAAKTKGTEGLTIDVMDGEGTVEGQLKKVVEGKVDAWTG
ncbi:hypothetical protein JCM24511_03885 [Saitozyma sp. JCM 24511]|nr:hypothetical protein JCM24511_03885 [Saitozyma sp. JCM 24511]